MEFGFNFGRIFFFNVAKKERKSLSNDSRAQIYVFF